MKQKQPARNMVVPNRLFFMGTIIKGNTTPYADWETDINGPGGKAVYLTIMRVVSSIEYTAYK